MTSSRRKLSAAIILGFVFACGFLSGALLLLFFPPRVLRTYYTCETCGALRVVARHGLRKEEGLLFSPPTSPGHVHRWYEGYSPGHPEPIRDGQIVLVRQGACYGAFAPRRQTVTPERIEYDWYLRCDGQGVFAGHEPLGVGKGMGVGSLVRFGPFVIPWSGRRVGEGNIYYHYFAFQAVPRWATRICVTSETDITSIDAADPKWRYKGSIAEEVNSR